MIPIVQISEGGERLKSEVQKPVIIAIIVAVVIVLGYFAFKTFAPPSMTGAAGPNPYNNAPPGGVPGSSGPGHAPGGPTGSGGPPASGGPAGSGGPPR